MKISFEHNGVQYVEYDINNEQSMSFLCEQIGCDELDRIMTNYQQPKNEMQILKETLDMLVLSLLGV